MCRKTEGEGFQKERWSAGSAPNDYQIPTPQIWMREGLDGSQRAEGRHWAKAGGEGEARRPAGAIRSWLSGKEGERGTGLHRVQAAHYGTKNGHAAWSREP